MLIDTLSFNESKFYLLIGILYSILSVFLIAQFSSSPIVIALLVTLPLFLSLSFNFKLIEYTFIISLFVNLFISGLYLSVYVVALLLFSFFLVYRDISFNFFNTPISKAILIYLLSVIPSLINSSKIFLSFFLMSNLIAFIVLVLVIGYSTKNLSEISRIIYFFVLMTFLDALVIIIRSIGGNLRIFGFSGVVFADFSSLTIIFLLITLLFKDKEQYLKRFIKSAGILLLLSTMIITQTRNSFITLLLSFLFIILFLFFNKKYLQKGARKVLLTLFGFLIIITTSILIINIYNPKVFGRFEELGKTNTIQIKSEGDFGRSSLFTRLLIWDTAINAFKKHPFIGIGAFSFPFESREYYTISKILYREYVQGLSPHIGYLAVLTETGIIGLVGFFFLLYSIIKMNYKALKLSKTSAERHISFSLLSFQVFIIFSLVFTDAWLWGQCGMLWGLLVGLSIANYKLLMNNVD